jgi:phytoene synthase
MTADGTRKRSSPSMRSCRARARGRRRMWPGRRRWRERGPMRASSTPPAGPVAISARSCAQRREGHVTAIDKHAPFIEQAQGAWGQNRRVSLRVGDMTRPPAVRPDLVRGRGLFHRDRAGACGRGARRWRRAGPSPSPNPCYFTDTPSDGARAFWGDEGIEVGTAAEIRRGWPRRGSRRSTRGPERRGVGGYFRPIADRIARLRPGADAGLAGRSTQRPRRDGGLARAQGGDGVPPVRGAPLMSLQACADLVARGDPDRFRAAMATPPEARAVLFPLYAFNLEVSRAPWVTEEPMIAEMRLQFWRDVAEEIGQGAPPRAHEVCAPLAAAVRAEDAGLLDGSRGRAAVGHLQGRVRGCWAFRAVPRRDGRQSRLGRGAGARRAGRGGAAVRDAAWAAALARFLVAVPELEARGRVPLVDGRAEAVAALARGGAHAPCGRARRGGRFRAGGLCAFAGWQAEAMLRRRRLRSGSGGVGRLSQGRGRSSWRLARMALSGRW